MPLVSILIACRNGEPFIESAVRSVLDQDAEIEVIVVDDGSTDTSRQTVSNIGDQRIRIVDGPRTGPAGATNAALAAARGELCVRCDADDLFTPGRLAFQLKWMSEHPYFSALCGQFQMITRSGAAVSTVGGGDSAEEVTGELAAGQTRTHWNTWMFRTAVARELGGCRTWFGAGEDVDMMLRFAPGHRVWYEPRVWYKYRLHEGTAVHAMPNVRRIFFEEQARLFVKQRAATGTDDLARGAPPPVPEAGNSKPYYARDQIQNVLIGRAWREHREGKKAAAIKTGMKAVLTKPSNGSAWKSFAALVKKKAGK